MAVFCSNSYEEEIKEKWGNTEAYKEYEQRMANCSKDRWQEITDGLLVIFQKFSACKQNGSAPDSAEAQSLIKELQDYISENYYTCTKQILKGLGQMYTADERFKNNIDKSGKGTAEFTSRAIEIYCE